MTALTIPAWSLPLALTLGLWAWMIFWPEPGSRGDYDFGPALRGLARLAGSVIGTLFFWLVYFMAKAAQ